MITDATALKSFINLLIFCPKHMHTSMVCELSVFVVSGLVSPPSIGTRRQQDFYSTFHKTPNRKKFSKKQWENFTEESTRQALAEWASSPDFTDWIVKNADRVKVLPDESSDETIGSGSDSTDDIAVESSNGLGFFRWQRRK